MATKKSRLFKKQRRRPEQIREKTTTLYDGNNDLGPQILSFIISIAPFVSLILIQSLDYSKFSVKLWENKRFLKNIF